MEKTSHARMSLYVFGTYLILCGLSVAAVADRLLPPLGFPVDNGPWSQLGGVLIAVVGFYYLEAARRDIKAFYPVTVGGRIVFVGGTALLVLLTHTRLTLLLLTTPDLIGALWTHLALRKEKSRNGNV